MKKIILASISVLVAFTIAYAGFGGPFGGGGGGTARTIIYDNSTSGLAATNLQALGDELAAALTSISTSGGISNLAYDVSAWDGVIAEAPSKNAVRDKIVLMEAALESHTSNDIDPDRLAGDAVDDNLIAAGILDSAVTLDTEWNTIAKIETATSVNIIVNTEIDSVAKLEALMTGTPNIIVSTEIDTAAKLNALTTDTDMVLDTDIDVTVQAYNATLAAVAGGTYTGDDSIATVGTITAGVWHGTAIDADYVNIYQIDTTITSRDNVDYVAIWDSSGTVMTKMTVGNFVTGLGGAGSSIVFDIGDDGGNDSTALGEIATSGDTNSIFTEPSADKLLINLANDWPKADQADVALTGDSATSFFSSGTLEDARIASTLTRDTEWDTEAEVQTAWGSVNILLETEIDASSELAAIMDDETGTGALVFANTPTLVTPVLGAATGTSIALGADPADAGAIRLSNADALMWEASAAGTDINALSVDSSEVIQIGSSGASGVTITPALTAIGNVSIGNGDTDTLTIWSLLIGADRAGSNDAIQIAATLATPAYAITSDDLYIAGVIEVAGNAYVNKLFITGSAEGSYFDLVTQAAFPAAAGSNSIAVVNNTFQLKEGGAAAVDIVTPNNSVTWTGTTHSFAGVTNMLLPTAAPDAASEIGIDTTNHQLKLHDGTRVVSMDFDSDSAGYVLKSDGSGNFTMQADATAGSPTINSVGDATGDTAIAFDINEEIAFNFTGAFTTGSQYLIEQKTGNPTGGILFEVKAADADVTLAKFGDGTNATLFSTGGNVTLAGTATITAGGVILGDSTPGTGGGLGYASNVLSFHDGTASRSVATLESAQTVTGVKTLGTTTAINFRDSAIHIASLDDGHLDLTADTSIDLNGAVSVTGALTANGASTIGDGGDNIEVYNDDTPANDHEWSGITILVRAGESVVYGDLVALADTTGTTVPTVHKADKDAEATMGQLAIVLGTAADQATVKVLIKGIIRDDSAFNFTNAGKAVYVGDAGAMVTTAGSTAGDFLQKVGYSLGQRILYLNPSPDYILLK